jgi:hypothetical protein
MFWNRSCGAFSRQRAITLARSVGTFFKIQQAAIELRLDDLKSMIRHVAYLFGTMLAASSAHDPDAKTQVLVIRYLLKCRVSVSETDKTASRRCIAKCDFGALPQ